MSAYAAITTHIDRASFSFWSKEEIKKVSVKRITEPKSFEKAGAIHPEGLYSNALGPVKKFELCTTCGLSDMACPGHFGHVELSVPCYNPMLVQTMFHFLNKFCIQCYHFRLSPQDLTLFLAQLEALNNGFDHLVDDLDETAKDICRGEKGESDYLNILLTDKLKQKIKEEKEKTPDFECQKRPQQRSIVDRLTKIFRNFINGQLIKPLKVCPHCGQKKAVLTLHQSAVIHVSTSSAKKIEGKRNKKKVSPDVEAQPSDTGDYKDYHYITTDERKYLTPIGVRFIFRKLWENEKQKMKKIFHFLNLSKQDPDSETIIHPTDLFFIDTFLVPPSKFRPPMTQRGYSFEGPRTAAMSNVMKLSLVVQDSLDKIEKEEDEIEIEKMCAKLQLQWKELQTAVNCLYDNGLDKYGKIKYPGLKQLIDKKEGLFRKNMMGKRVNFAARSVISPDPNISVDQIGVPLVFAKKLTYPQPVTPWNVKELREAVLKGPDDYPGACSVMFEDGVTKSLQKESVRVSIASRLTYNPRPNMRFQKGRQDTPMVTIVNRHLLSGDILLFNRQPTLHKPSIMAFRARVLPNEKGFRLHYANCKSFNADFDGDEMNAHLPQSELARSEAYNIASVNHQYLVPKDGSPLGGLIQDHVVAVCILTRRDQILDKDRYNQLVFCALGFLDKQIKLEPPAIMKPEPLWTGKQVITTIIKNCIPSGKRPPTLKIKSKIGPKILNISAKYEELSDCHVYIKDGELVTGFMDKSNVGATQNGLVHTCYELYGGETSSNIMSAFARLSTWYLQLYEGFTLGIGDILVEDDANADRSEMIQASRTVGPDSAKEALGITKEIDTEKLEDKLREAHSDRDPLPMKKLDAAMKKRTDKASSDISGRCLPEGLIRRFPDNNLQMMIQSGAKGGTVNALQISCLLGQIELEGRRVPLSMSGRSLPSFKPYDTSPKAGGFVSGRFLTGIQPQEFFFHCMAGREGLIDTAVKTSRSGYLQRCLIKHLEGLTVQYDQTVRDSCGSVIQFLYGEDGLDVVKSQFLKDKAFPLLVDNSQIISPTRQELDQLNKLKESYEEDVIVRTDLIQEWLDKHGDNRIRRIRGSGFLDFQMDHGQLEPDEMRNNWFKLSFKEKRKWNKNWDNCPDPLISFFNPGAHFGVVPEKLDEKIEQFVRKNPQLIIDSASLLGSSGDDVGAINLDSNALLSETLMNFYNRLPTDGLHTIKPKMTKHEFYELCYNLYMKMLAQPGEAVGLLAAQSIGEPSTQMTLNTFHFAGRGEMNVTLGIPRLREILMTASAKIGTPSMDLPLLTKLHDESGNELSAEEVELEAQRVKLALNAVRLSDVLEYVDVTEQEIEVGDPKNEIKGVGDRHYGKGRKRVKGEPSTSNKGGRKSISYKLLFHLLPSKCYKQEFRTSTRAIFKFIEEEFVVQLIDSMLKRKKRLAVAESMFDLSQKRINKAKTGANDAEGNDGADKGENDVDEKELDDYNAKAKAKEKVKEDQESSSDEDDEDEREVEEQELDYYVARAKAEENEKEEGRLSGEDNDDDEVVVVGADNEVDNGGVKSEPVLDVDDMAAMDNYKDDDDDEEGNRNRLKNNEETGAMPDIPVIKIEEDASDQEDSNDIAASASVAAELTARKRKREAMKLEAEQFEAKVRNIPYVEDYRRVKRRSCELTIVMELTNTRLDMGELIAREARHTFVHRVGNISRALIVKDVGARDRGAKCDKMIKTEGVSLLSLVRFNHILDLNSIYSNDIHAIARTYGIEAASQAIRREMANVFAVYGIEVDPRHLSLIADYMTYNGTIKGMNRLSMEASASPFQQMSYESTIHYLKMATVLGLCDDIKSPSAALVFGKPTRGGTGLFSTIVDPAKMRQTGKQHNYHHNQPHFHQHQRHDQQQQQTDSVRNEVWR